MFQEGNPQKAFSHSHLIICKETWMHVFRKPNYNTQGSLSNVRKACAIVRALFFGKYAGYSYQDN